MKPITRRAYLKQSALIALLSGMGFTDVMAASKKLRLKIGACDWSMGKRGNVEALDLARKIGLAGVQVDLGSSDNNLHVRKASIQQAYLAESKRTNIKITSLAIGELNNVPYKSEPQTEAWVSDSIDVANAFGVNVVLLAFFHKNDLRNDTAGKEEVIKRLKAVAPKAEKQGVILGIESYLSAAGHQEIIQRVGSKNIKVYYDFRNTADAGYDAIHELKQLGRDAICELHIKENGKLLGEGTINWFKVGEALAAMDYKGEGWMQIEWSLPKDKDVVDGYKHNLSYLRGAFNNQK